MNSLVSVIIPCYNSERWISEAIDSILAQTYPNIEIIVVDDGSTDSSLEIIKSYGDRLKWVTGTNQGGNVARNRGFQLSKGKYIQWLDADDYLLPEKIAHQIEFLATNNCDVVYGDWQHQYHQEDGSNSLGNIKLSGQHLDTLEALLSGWWASPAAYLIKRKIVIEINGWDETLKAGQDRDFWIRVAIALAKFVYQPGCYSIYRRYGNVTVSTKNCQQWCDSHAQILENARASLKAKNNLQNKYKKALAKSHFALARNYFDRDRNLYQYHLNLAKELNPDFRPSESGLYNLYAKFLGFTLADYLASWKRKVKTVATFNS
ncbi:MAG TPA: glycosyltransferase [Coleofasciculaceae cyanobacterium]|jgi:glycosyltransferase involved in cell wall biosynthesis